ncbi:MAG: RNA 2',3'-cyclic phosphodiesterase [Myxococcaceae bacterium]|nr:RNA 2',3'-cyclic phosphodiesterase [Myxococcaceae bacterium]
MSVFLAIDLDDAARTLAAQVIEQHRPLVPAKWVRADKLHLTLVFLGNADPGHVEGFKPVIDALARRHQPFSLELASAGTFGTARAPSVLWLGVAGAVEPLRALQADAQRALLTQQLPGLSPKEHERAFTPHVTLARSKHNAAFAEAATALSTLRSRPFTVAQLTLYESRADRYQALHRAPLG